MFKTSSQPLKLVLFVLLITLLATTVFIVLTQRGMFSEKVATPVTNQPQPQTAPSVPPTEVHRVLGIVEQNSGREITLKDFRKISSVVSAVSDKSARMFIVVDQSTVIERFTYKDAAVLNAEFDVFYKNIQKAQVQNPSAPLTPPEPFALEKVALRDIKIGDRITASFAEDIEKLTIFTATKIEIKN